MYDMVKKEYDMDKISKIKKVFFYIILAYLIYLTIYLAGEKISILQCSQNMITYFLQKYTKVLDLYRITLIGGIFSFILAGLLAGKKLFRKDSFLLLSFFVISLISVFINKDLGIGENLLETLKICNVISLFYIIHRAFKSSWWTFTIKRIIFWGIGIWNFGCLFSLALYLFNYHGYYFFNGFNRASRQGIVDGRLFGCFSDPNYAAFISLLLGISLIWLLKRMKNKIIRGYIYFSLVVNLIYIILSGSRSTYITIIALIIFYVLYIQILKHIMNKSSLKTLIKSSLIRIFIGLVIAIFVYLIVLFSFKGLGYLFRPERDFENEFTRNDVSEENISNSRFRIWGDYLLLLKDRPVFGFSSKGALNYAIKKDPQSYLSDRKYNAHSVYIYTLISSGILGFLAIASFFIYIIINLWKYKKDNLNKMLKPYFIYNLGIIFSHFVFCFFNLGIITSYRFETILFWLSLGYIADLVFKNNKQKTSK